jgi:hypothetical protein
MQICSQHYYCTCGNYKREDSGVRKVCHYCRKRQTFYRDHFICLKCHYGWKSQNETTLVSTVDDSYFRIVGKKSSRCSKCGVGGIEVGKDFRVPKKSDTKAWKELENERAQFDNEFKFSSYMIKKHTYNCGGGDRWDSNKQNLYAKRNK